MSGDRAEQGVGDHVGDELHEADFLAGVDAGDRAGVQAGDVDVHAGAGFEDVGDDQADQHRDQRQDEEVAECLDADTACSAQAVHGGDAEGHDAEHDGNDDHLDQPDEPVVERCQCLTDVGEQDADGDAQHGAEDDLEPELADQGPESRSLWWGVDGGCGHDKYSLGAVSGGDGPADGKAGLGGGRWPGSGGGARRPAVASGAPESGVQWCSSRSTL